MQRTKRTELLRDLRPLSEDELSFATGGVYGSGARDREREFPVRDVVDSFVDIVTHFFTRKRKRYGF